MFKFFFLLGKINVLGFWSFFQTPTKNPLVSSTEDLVNEGWLIKEKAKLKRLETYEKDMIILKAKLAEAKADYADFITLCADEQLLLAIWIKGARDVQNYASKISLIENYNLLNNCLPFYMDPMFSVVQFMT